MFPYYYRTQPNPDSEYLRALAEERAAREQFAAARRAQEEARQRAARARAARRAYASPYNSYHDDDYADLDLGLGMDLDDPVYYPRQRPVSYAGDGLRPFGYGLGDPYQQRALLEEQRRREILEEQRRREILEEQRRRELLEVEKERERRRLEEERIRRILEEERQREEAARQKLLEEDRLRRALEEERIKRALREEEEARRNTRAQERSHQQAALEPLLRALGFVPASSGLDTESEKERLSREARTHPAQGRRTKAPSPSPIRPFPFSRPSPTPNTHNDAPSPPATTIPITSPKPAPRQPTAEQAAAASKIQSAFRAHSSRKHALKAVATMRKRFLTARNGFTLPTTLDYDIGTHGRVPPTPVSVPSSVVSSLPQAPAHGEEEESAMADVPRLAYTPTNAPLHAYEEELNRILSALDAVESRGDLGVRAARRELARTVEREAERVEQWRSVVWTWWKTQEATKEQVLQSGAAAAEPQPEATSMEVEPAAPMDASSSFAAEASAPATEVTQTDLSAMDVEPEPELQPSPSPEASVSVNPSSSIPPQSAPAPDEHPLPVIDSVPSPEIDITDASPASVSSSLSVDVDVEVSVEPPSRAEPASELEQDVSEPELQSAPSEPEPELDTAPPPTPALSFDHERVGDDVPMDADTEPEAQEVHTPTMDAHAPLPVLITSPDADSVQSPPVVEQLGKQPTPVVEAGWDAVGGSDVL